MRDAIDKYAPRGIVDCVKDTVVSDAKAVAVASLEL
jgi:hypothetical protein